MLAFYFFTTKGQRSKLLHSVTRQDSVPVAFAFCTPIVRLL